MSVPLAQLLHPRHLVLDSWTHERTFHRPGAGVSSLYRVEAVDRDGNVLTLYAGATTTDLPADAPGTLRSTLAGTTLQLWVHPHDPLLPALPWALSSEDIARDIFGRPASGAREAELRLAAYRPLRRAVVRATSENSTAYLKILLPGQAEGLSLRHRLLAGSAVPVAGLVEPGNGADLQARGAVVLTALDGEPMLRSLTNGSHGPAPEDLTSLLDQFPETILALKPRPAWATRARAYGAAATAVLPGEADRITDMARRIERLVRRLDPGPVVPVHGDFYEGNLLVSGGGVSGLLDLDGLGPGHRVDDLACFVGHQAVLAELSPDSALPGALARFGSAFGQAAEHAGSSAAALNARAAGVALSLVSGARAGRLSRTGNALARLNAAGKLLAEAETAAGPAAGQPAAR